ncbi:MAG: UDP-N-acetylmuramate--L-alanine ligase [Clostridia bacterium]|nr:UDP-N-acetylmuramate--L-alanine ligase [Clostridia bacterium]
MGLKGLKKGEKFYFIGIGGVSMSGLAYFLIKNGYQVQGSDLFGGEQVEKLRMLGVDIAVGEAVDLTRVCGADTVVYTDAISQENKELNCALFLNKRVYSRMDFLRLLCEEFSHVIAVAGSHGKTTCTAMCAHILKSAKVGFSAHIGGEDSEMGNFFFEGVDYLVTEACEYKKNLLKLVPETAILLNIDCDHMECYDGEEDLKNTFYAFCRSAKTAIVCLDDERSKGVENAVTFSILDKTADYRASHLSSERERYAFTVYEYGRKVCRVRLKTVGRCNVYNALAAFAAMRSYGFSAEEIKRGLESFRAVKRRFEEIGTIFGATAVCDYAHHPKEILSSIATAKRICAGKLFVVFQPHTFSRTKALMEEFVSALRGVERLMIYKTYPARERFNLEGDGKTLAERIGNCLYSESVVSLSAWLKRTVKETDCVLFLGAGDIYFLAQYLAKGVKNQKK